KDYSHISDTFRPYHADYTYSEKYGIRAYRSEGRYSARATAARVAGGAVTKQFLKANGISIQAFVSQVGDLTLDKSYTELNLDLAEENIVRCPDPEMADKMISLIDAVRLERDTIGGVVTCVIKNTPPGLGEPVFD